MTTYSVVINNPTGADSHAITEALQMGWEVVGQKEVGQNGTPHYQLAVTADTDWAGMKAHFKRANIQEAKDPEALKVYCTKEKTRVLDFAVKKDSSRVRPTLAAGTIQFFESMFKEMNDTWGEAADEHIKGDDSLKLYDAAVNEMILVEGYTTALRATRPDVRSTYRKYRYAMWSVWWYKNLAEENSIVIETHQEDADDDEVSGDEDTSDVQEESVDGSEAEDEEESEAASEQGTSDSD